MPHIVTGDSMALVKCPECGSEVSSQAASCPNCGMPMKQEEKAAPPQQASQTKNGCGIGCGLLLLLAVGGSAISLAITGRDPDYSKDVYEEVGWGFRIFSFFVGLASFVAMGLVIWSLIRKKGKKG